MPKRRDCNHAEIRDGLRKCGFHVTDLADLGKGVPDLLSVTKDGQAILLEVKIPGEKLTPAEERYHAEYPGPIYIVRSVEQAIETMQGVMRK